MPPRVALPLNGVHVEAHGAASAVVKNDPQGALFAAVRGVVGAGVPVVATLDLHGNVSRRMVAETDLGISTEPNPLL